MIGADRFRPPGPQSIVVGLVLIMMAIMMLAQTGCGPSARKTTLAAELAALNTARDAFVRWDRAKQMAILERAPDRATYDAQIAAYRTIQAVIVNAFERAYSQIAEAATDDKRPMPTVPDVILRALKGLKPGADPPVLPCSNPIAEKLLCVRSP